MVTSNENVIFINLSSVKLKEKLLIDMQERGLKSLHCKLLQMLDVEVAG